MRQEILDAAQAWAIEIGLTTAEKLDRLAANKRGRLAVERMERGETVGICINEPCVMFTFSSNGGDFIPIRVR